MERSAVPRGRHAPPLQVRLDVQRERLFAAAATVFARAGYAEASAESIARAAGMSKATFYEHFANKEECLLALFDASAAVVLQMMADAVAAAGKDPEARMRAGVRAFLEGVASRPAESQTVLVEIIGAGPRASERRDVILNGFAQALAIEAENGGTPFASPDDSFSVIAAGAELSSRELRRGQPDAVRDLAGVLDRLIAGLLTR